MLSLISSTSFTGFDSYHRANKSPSTPGASTAKCSTVLLLDKLDTLANWEHFTPNIKKFKILIAEARFLFLLINVFSFKKRLIFTINNIFIIYNPPEPCRWCPPWGFPSSQCKQTKLRIPLTSIKAIKTSFPASIGRKFPTYCSNLIH